MESNNLRLSVGQHIEAKWSDGLVLTGRYGGTDRGYVILLTETGKRIACSPTAVSFKVINERR